MNRTDEIGGVAAAARLDHGPNCQNSPVSSLFKPVNPCDNQASLSFHQVQINNHLNLQSQSSSLIFTNLLATLFYILIYAMGGTVKLKHYTMQLMHTISVQFTCT